MNTLFARKFSCELMALIRISLFVVERKNYQHWGCRHAAALTVSGDLLLIQEASYVTYSLILLATARVRSYSYYS